MAKNKRGKNVQAKGLKGALARLAATEDQRTKTKLKSENALKNQKLKKQSITGANKNKKHQVAASTGLLPFEPESVVLLVGEGDFSFAKSVINQQYIKPANLIATSFDSVKDLEAKYPGVDKTLQFLQEQGVNVLHDIDATKLVESLKLNTKKGRATKIFERPLTHIMFNFPHNGKGMKDVDRNIREHQKLVLGYFQSCKKLLEVVNDEINDAFSGYASSITKPKSRIIVTLFEGEPYISWQIKQLGRSESWFVEKSGKLDWSMFPGYHHKRTSGLRDTTKPAAERDARIYVFEELSTQESKTKESDSD